MDQDEDAFVAMLLAEILDARHEGRPVSVDEYVARHPRLERIVRRVFAEATGADGSPAPERDGLPGTWTEVKEPPARLGHYVIERMLGRGGQGDVLLATDPRLGRQVAIKVLHAFAALSPESVARFRREAELAARLDHPGICPVYDTGAENGIPFIVMRYVEGVPLTAAVRPPTATVREGAAPEPIRHPAAVASPQGRAALRRILGLVEDAARALHHAHEHGVLHRDVKPANILVTPEGRPVILDFGIGRPVGGDHHLRTRTGDVFGTPAYLAPELLLTPPIPADRRTDVYALGVTLFECATGRRPFEAPTLDGLCRSILRAEPADPRSFNPAISRETGVVIRTAIEVDRDRRYRTAWDLAEDLRRIREGEPVLARPAGPVLRLRRWVTRDPTRAALFGLILLVVAAAAWWAAKWPEMSAAAEAGRAQDRHDAVARLLERGYFEIGTGRYAMARGSFAAALGIAPGDPEAIAGSAIALASDGRAPDAVRFLEAFRAVEAAHPGLTWVRAHALREAGRAGDADEALRTVGKPSDSLSLFCAGVIAVLAAEFGDASSARAGLELMTRCLLTHGTTRALYAYQAAWAAGVAGDASEGRRFADLIERRWPDSPASWYWIAWAVKDSDFERARAAADECLRREPGNARARVVLAAVLQELGRGEEAVAAARAAVESEPDAGFARFDFGTILLQQNEIDAAIAELEHCVQLEPWRGQAHSNLGVARLLRGETSAAAAALAEATRVMPRNVDAWNNLAGARHALGDSGGARDAAERAVVIKPDQGEPHHLLGILRAEEGDLTGALQELRTAARLAPSNPKIHASLGNCLADGHHHREALVHLRLARELGRDVPAWNPPSEETISRCEAMSRFEDLLDAVLRGPDPVLAPAEKVEVARVARAHGLFVVAADLFDAAAAADPSIMRTHAREAAVSALRAGRWDRALVILEAARIAIEADVRGGRMSPARGARILGEWMEEPEFETVRAGAPVPLPEPDRFAWERFWSALRSAADAWSQ